MSMDAGLLKAYHYTFKSAEGEAVLADLMKRFALPPFVAGKPDQTAYNCGTKAVIEHIFSQVQAADSN